MSPKIVFALFLFGCALLALVNADRYRKNYPPSNYNLGPGEDWPKNVHARQRMVETPSGQCCPCPDESPVFRAGSQRRYVNQRRRTVETPIGECECPCENGEGSDGTGDADYEDSGKVQNPVSAHDKIERRQG